MNATMMFEFVLGLIRHGLTAAGGWLVSAGVATGEEATTLSGAVITLIGLGWSFYRKWKRG